MERSWQPHRTETYRRKAALITGRTTGNRPRHRDPFAKQGARVVISGRREAERKEAIALVKAAEAKHLRPVDVSKTADVQIIGQKTVEPMAALTFL